MTFSTVDRLTLLWKISQLFSSTLDLEKVLNLVIDQVIEALNAERGIVLLFDDEGSLQVRVARGIDRQTLESPEFDFSRSIVTRVAQEGQPLLTSDAQDESWLSNHDSVVALGLRSVLCVPLRVKGQLIGVIYVDNRLRSGLFMPADLELLTTIAGSAANAIENARLYLIAVEKGRIERELEMARALQASFIPQELPALPGWDIAACWYPAREVSGDYYDFPQAIPGQLGVVIADVSDKGLGSALFMTLTRTIVRASVEGSSSPATAIAQANRLICADATDGMFVTLCYAAVEPVSGIVTYVNAGHNPPLLFRAEESEAVALSRTGILLGIDPTASFQQDSVQLASGDLLLLYTDGITDAQNAAFDMFGEQRLREVITAHRHETAEALLRAIMAAIHDFAGTAPPFDDITAVLLRRL
jgi:sigma-B regulation protein RsbU (phosphoserine phosphatase)